MFEQRERIAFLAYLNIPIVHFALLIGGGIVGLFNGGMLGLLTGLSSVWFVTAGFRATETGSPESALWVHRAIRVSGLITVVLTVFGAVVGGWAWGWGGALAGYIFAMPVNRGLFLLVERQAQKSPQYQEMLDTFDRIQARGRLPVDEGASRTEP